MIPELVGNLPFNFLSTCGEIRSCFSTNRSLKKQTKPANQFPEITEEE